MSQKKRNTLLNQLRTLRQKIKKEKTNLENLGKREEEMRQSIQNFEKTRSFYIEHVTGGGLVVMRVSAETFRHCSPIEG